MNVIIELETGEAFSIETGYFYPILDIKEKIQRAYNIPVSKQTLAFNGQILLDDTYVLDYDDLLENSRIRLAIAQEPPENPPPQSDQINLLLVLPTTNMQCSHLRIDVDTKIHQLKEMILTVDLGTINVAIDRIVLQLNNGMELSHDEISLRDYNLRDESVIHVTVKEAPTMSSSSGSGSASSSVINSSPRSSLQNPHMNLEETFSAPPNLEDIFSVPPNLEGIFSVPPNLENIFSVPPPQSDQINLLVKIPVANAQYSCLQVSLNDKIHQVKQKILTMDGMSNVPINQIILVSNGVYLSLDEKTLRDHGIIDGAKIDVWILPSLTNSSSVPGINSGQGTVRFLVSSRCGTSKMEVQMNDLNKVGELRKVLEKQINFPLPQQGYFFIHKNNVMEDDKSFRSHQVQYGDTIDVCPISSSENPPVNMEVIFSDLPGNLKDIFFAPPPKSDQINVLIKLPSKKVKYSRLEIGVNDKIQQLKQKILTMDVRMKRSVRISHLLLRLNGTTELSDNEKTLRDCGIKEGAKIDVTIKALPISSSSGSGSGSEIIKPSPTNSSSGSGPATVIESSPIKALPISSSSGSGSGSEIVKASPTNSSSGSGPVTVIKSSPKIAGDKVSFKVVSKCGKKKIEVDMSIFDNVDKLRKVLEKQNTVPLPEEGYFFIHKQAVMEDDKSFGWHMVNHGDTIDVFPGWVTKGSP